MRQLHTWKNNSLASWQFQLKNKHSNLGVHPSRWYRSIRNSLLVHSFTNGKRRMMWRWPSLLNNKTTVWVWPPSPFPLQSKGYGSLDITSEHLANNSRLWLFYVPKMLIHPYSLVMYIRKLTVAAYSFYIMTANFFFMTVPITIATTIIIIILRTPTVLCNTTIFVASCNTAQTIHYKKIAIGVLIKSPSGNLRT